MQTPSPFEEMLKHHFNRARLVSRIRISPKMSLLGLQRQEKGEPSPIPPIPIPSTWMPFKLNSMIFPTQLARRVNGSKNEKRTTTGSAHEVAQKMFSFYLRIRRMARLFLRSLSSYSLTRRKIVSWHSSAREKCLIVRQHHPS